MSVRADPFVAGIGMTAFGVAPEATVRSLAEHAVAAALADAGLAPESVDLVVFANAAGGLYDGQEMIRGEVALRGTALAGTALVNVENACASASSALAVGCMAIRSGSARVVLVVGAEKLAQPARARAFAMLGGAVDLEDHPTIRRGLRRHVLGGLDDADAADGVEDDTVVASPFMAMYAERTRRYQERSGATDRDLAAVSVKNRAHGAANPLAQFRRPVDIDEVLASRPIADPLRLLMCSPIADGAAAVVLTAVPGSRWPAVAVRACEIRTGTGTDGAGPVAVAAAAAYAVAGVDPTEIDVVEVHDAAASAELWVVEELGLTDDGVGWHADGATRLGGRQPVNPSGGLLARGHPIGATGAAQIVELVTQLRGAAGGRQVDGARFALAENGGGILDGREAVAVVTVLEGVR